VAAKQQTETTGNCLITSGLMNGVQAIRHPLKSNKLAVAKLWLGDLEKAERPECGSSRSRSQWQYAIWRLPPVKSTSAASRTSGTRAKHHLRKFNGVLKAYFPLFLKECEWRFKNPYQKVKLSQLNQWVANF
jgi:hypothetical protein